MKTVFKTMMVCGVVAILTLLECILNSACNLVAYPVPRAAKMIDNTKIEQPESLTLFVYMAADNDLESHAIRNLKAMERADFSNINVLVLLDRAPGYDQTNDDWTDTRLFEVSHDTSNNLSIASKRLDCPPLGLTTDSQTELDMGSFNVLKTFIEFGKANYKAQNYALIMWGHGTGWRAGPSTRAVAIDDTTKSYISVKELGAALCGQDLCVIGFDTCFGSTFENLYELKNCAQYITASPSLTPAAGWDYHELLNKLGACKLPEEIASVMKDASRQPLTVTKTSELTDIMNCIENFSKSLSAEITDESARRQVLDNLLNTKSYCYTSFPSDMYIDLFSMAHGFSTSQDEELRAASQNLCNATSGLAIGLLLMPKISDGVLAACHSPDYIKNDDNQSQCAFIKDSVWWVPTKNGNSQSLLDKLFYWNF